MKKQIIDLKSSAEYLEVEERIELSIFRILEDFDLKEDGLNPSNWKAYKLGKNGIILNIKETKKNIGILTNLKNALNWFKNERELWENDYQKDNSLSEKYLRDTYYLSIIIKYRNMLWT